MILSYMDKTPKIKKSSFIAKGAVVIGDVEIGENSSIWYNAVIRGDESSIRIGNNTNIQDNSTVHISHYSKTFIGNNVTIGHNAIIHGCEIKDNVLVGMGSTILDNAVINENVIIGANSLITSNVVIPKNSLVLGSPAKVIRSLTKDEIESIKQSAQSYVAEAEAHKNGGKYEI